MARKGHCKRAQSAMEYLMTYGWAILIIAVVLAALFQLGVFNSSSFSPKAPPGACQVIRPSGPGTTTNINVMGACTGQLPQYVAQLSGASSYVRVTDSNLLDLTSAFTLSAWIKAGSTPNTNNYVIGKHESGPNWYGYAFSLLSDRRINFYTDVGGWKNGNVVSLNNWHHIVATFGSSVLKIYVDNVLDVSVTSSGATASSADLYLGRDIGGTQQFTGSVSNVQIYNTSLSANEIQALYVEGMGAPPILPQNLVGWWPLNGNANDYSGNNGNGVPTGVSFTTQYGK